MKECRCELTMLKTSGVYWCKRCDVHPSRIDYWGIYAELAAKSLDRYVMKMINDGADEKENSTTD